MRRHDLESPKTQAAESAKVAMTKGRTDKKCACECAYLQTVSSRWQRTCCSYSAHGVHAHVRSWGEAGPAHAVNEGPDNPAALLLTSSGMQVPAAYLFVVK